MCRKWWWTWAIDWGWKIREANYNGWWNASGKKKWIVVWYATSMICLALWELWFHCALRLHVYLCEFSTSLFLCCIKSEVEDYVRGAQHWNELCWLNLVIECLTLVWSFRVSCVEFRSLGVKIWKWGYCFLINLWLYDAWQGGGEVC